MYSNQTRAPLRFTLMYSLATLALITGCRDLNEPDTASPADESTSASPASAPQQQEPATAPPTHVATRSLDLSTEAEEKHNQTGIKVHSVSQQPQPATGPPRDLHVFHRLHEPPPPGNTTGPAPTAEEQEEARDQLKKALQDATDAINDRRSIHSAVMKRTLPSDDALQRVNQNIAKIEVCLEQANEAQTKVPEEKMYVPRIQTRLALAQVVKIAILSACARLKAEDAVETKKSNAAVIIANAKSVIDQAYEVAQATVKKEIAVEVPAAPGADLVRVTMDAINHSLGKDRDTTAAAKRYLGRIEEDKKKVAARLEEIARKMLVQGLDMQLICDTTGLSIERLKQLQHEVQ